nr:MAG TPA: hypothetical protein [Caudoviricetes sp.]DAO35048.1 MAG TPA: hypothetical protein [Caudoviricetes sp.]DAQ91375.1 MAG TPA: hypothetical protein [Caudoviricetes sp.]
MLYVIFAILMRVYYIMITWKIYFVDKLIKKYLSL